MAPVELVVITSISTRALVTAVTAVRTVRLVTLGTSAQTATMASPPSEVSASASPKISTQTVCALMTDASGTNTWLPTKHVKTVAPIATLVKMAPVHALNVLQALLRKPVPALKMIMVVNALLANTVTLATATIVTPVALTAQTTTLNALSVLTLPTL